MKAYLEIFNFNNLINYKTGFISVVGASVGAFLTKLYGGEVGLYIIGALTLGIVLDWLGAIAAATKDKSYSSQYGIIGVIRTAVILALPVFGKLLDSALSTQGFIFYMLSIGLLYHTLVSMTANFKRAGWERWIPTWALDLIASELEAKVKRAQTRKGEDK
ncbi:phage holin family protein [Neobacillus sp. 3P2-tot-E-2]|uniref:phage holin family protein n=1 Tax=Neobacillus sp. 3P2-tot-E-2 TaxID=3132212 RepID=UPI0039A11687